MTDLPWKDDRVSKAVQYFFEIKEQKPELSQNKILEKTVLHFDLSPKESLALQHHFNK